MNFRYIQEIEKRIKQLRETEENTLEEAASHIICTLRQPRRPAAYGSRGLFQVRLFDKTRAGRVGGSLSGIVPDCASTPPRTVRAVFPHTALPIALHKM